MTKYITAQDVSRPAARGFYTKRAAYHDLFIRLERLEDLANSADANSIAIANQSETGTNFGSHFSWLKKEEVQKLLGEELTISEYRSIVQQLTKLYEHSSSVVIRDDLAPFIRPGTGGDSKAGAAGGDEDGESSTTIQTIGRRKNSTAVVELEPWVSARALSDKAHYGVAYPRVEQDITVNGQPLAGYFARAIDRYEVLKPLEITNVLSTYKVSANVRGGGNTGQAGAIRLGIARAIALLQPELRHPLKGEKMLRRDPRMVERKKPGQKGARKKFQWVKR
jgi:small subunit ribosomal protein S9